MQVSVRAFNTQSQASLQSISSKHVFWNTVQYEPVFRKAGLLKEHMLPSISFTLLLASYAGPWWQWWGFSIYVDENRLEVLISNNSKDADG